MPEDSLEAYNRNGDHSQLTVIAAAKLRLSLFENSIAP